MKSDKKNIIFNDLWTVRSAGFLLPLFSVRTEKSLGIGDIGDLYRLIDWASRHGQRIIQLLPLTDTRPGDPSPYAAVSVFAVNPLYINTDKAVDIDRSDEAGILLEEWKTDGTLDALRSSDRIDYDTVRAVKMGLLTGGFRHFLEHEWREKTERADELSQFIENEGLWLNDYASFSVLKERYKGENWRSWPEMFKFRDNSALAILEEECGERMLFYKWLQWLFAAQWAEMRSYAHEKDVYLMGDVSFYPGGDSVDVWANTALFQMDEDLEPAATSGAPPDQFNRDGQDWGTPLYNWDAMEEDDFSWWKGRVKRVGEFFDLYRLDHFRGFESYWRVPRGRKASEGEWVKGPGGRLLQRILKVSLCERLIIPLAEDLGDISAEVHSMRKRLGIAGYKTFIFGWGEGEESGVASGYRYPEKYTRDFLATTGTHDTPTLGSWWECLPEDERRALLEYLDLSASSQFLELKDAVLRRLLDSEAQFVVLPFQDIFGLGEEHRINYPGTFGSQNWTWRMPLTVEHLLSGSDDTIQNECRGLAEMIRSSGRILRGKGEKRTSLVGVLPQCDTVQERKAGEIFNIWTAIRGKRERVVMCIGSKDMEMALAAELKDGTLLYKAEVKALKGGTLDLRICADEVEVVIEGCLKVVE